MSRNAVAWDTYCIERLASLFVEQQPGEHNIVDAAIVSQSIAMSAHAQHGCHMSRNAVAWSGVKHVLFVFKQREMTQHVR